MVLHKVFTQNVCGLYFKGKSWKFDSFLLVFVRVKDSVTWTSEKLFHFVLKASTSGSEKRPLRAAPISRYKFGFRRAQLRQKVRYKFPLSLSTVVLNSRSRWGYRLHALKNNFDVLRQHKDRKLSNHKLFNKKMEIQLNPKEYTKSFDNNSLKQ